MTPPLLNIPHTVAAAPPSPPPPPPPLVQPEPCWGPEAVVMAQLEALQAGDASGVFRFASPSNQAATGPVERFAGMLEVRQRAAGR